MESSLQAAFSFGSQAKACTPTQPTQAYWHQKMKGRPRQNDEDLPNTG